jgi:hypothetical protein
LHKKIPIKKEILHFAARLGDQQASMACGAVGCPIAAPIVWFVIGANGVI